MLSLRSKITLVISIIIMVTFFSVLTSVVLGYAESSKTISKFEFYCILLFMPFFFLSTIDFVSSAQNKNQEISDKLKAIDNSNIVIEFDLKGNIIATNEIFCRLIGIDKKDILNLNLIQFWDTYEWTKDKYGMFWYHINTRGVSSQGEYKFLKSDNEVLWLNGNFNPIKDQYGIVYKTIFMSTNITEKKLIESEVNKKNGYLEYAAKILRHDMHSGINTYIPRGLNSLFRRLTPENIETLKIESPLKMIKEGLTHTQKVYKGVYEFTNLVKTDSKLNTEPCDLKQILLDYLSNTSYIKQVVINDLVTADVNQALFCTAVDNLIRNGLKYNDNETKLINIFMENDNTLAIQDNGRGMTQEEFEYLSQPYTRKEDQKESGSGLGLNICVAIIKEHNFVVSSEKNEIGTKIKIKL
jgi:PAS domain S-box-containing protein